MFENDIFENWLDEKSKEIVSKLGNKESLSSEEMIVLVLKAQTNHFHHLDSDLRADMVGLRVDFQNDIKELRSDMMHRFEQVDKRFERSYAFMKWQTGLGIVFASGILLKLILG
ncbi:hypothetical protein MNBD_UNCLBAC01-1688 [hydrothermal vent metagenome]|uniref:DUF1640 domain-containing protein n=1 Tax=hydrothermal vent metagenome TaxID=652676 RepID=A0A3B1DJR7_9ZZZZ